MRFVRPVALCSWLLVACAADGGAGSPPRDQDPGDLSDAAGGTRTARDAGDAATNELHDAAAIDLHDAARPADAGSAPSPDANTPDAAQDAAPQPDATTPSCGDGAFCADFEDLPKGSLSGAWSARTPNCSGDGTANIDDSVAHSGRHAIRVAASGNTCNHVFATPALDLARFGSSLWVRFYVRFASALPDAHVTFLALHDEVSQKSLRMGGQKEILMWNRESDDATLPELSPTGVSLSVRPSPNSWQCVEFQLAGASGTLETYVDGARVPGLVVDGVATQDIDGQWLRPGKWTARVSDLGFGWESYGNEAMTLWFDDIAVAGQRLGC